MFIRVYFTQGPMGGAVGNTEKKKKNPYPQETYKLDSYFKSKEQFRVVNRSLQSPTR